MSQTSSLWEITIHTLLLFDYENYEDKSGSRDDGENEDESYSNITTAGEEDTDVGTVNSNVFPKSMICGSMLSKWHSEIVISAKSVNALLKHCRSMTFSLK